MSRPLGQPRSAEPGGAHCSSRITGGRGGERDKPSRGGFMFTYFNGSSPQIWRVLSNLKSKILIFVTWNFRLHPRQTTGPVLVSNLHHIWFLPLYEICSLGSCYRTGLLIQWPIIDLFLSPESALSSSIPGMASGLAFTTKVFIYIHT